MKLDFSDQSAPAARPLSTLPEPRLARWQPLRLGLLELYRYDSEEFWFRDGHLLLRGNNGTGKSKVLSLTLPLLLDANLRSARVEPDGDPGKKMGWNLLLGGTYDRRTGYSWIEFGRVAEDGSPRYLTIGVGLLAVAARAHVEPWFFIVEEDAGARIGQDLWLVNAQRVVLTRERLREALAGRGQVFDNAAAYRRAVDERLFHLGARRYDALMDTLIQLRQPQLSRRPDESSLSDALTEALPPLPQELLADVAEAMNQLEEDRRQLEDFQKLETAVVHFDARYRGYAGVLSRRQARELRQAQTEFDNASRERNEANTSLASALGTEATARENHGVADITLKGQRMRLDTLLSDPAMQAANRLEQAKRDAEARQRDFETAEEQARGAGKELQREADQLRQRHQQRDESRRRLDAQQSELARFAQQVGLQQDCEAEPLAAAPPQSLAASPEPQLAASARRLLEAATRRRKDIGLVRQRLRERGEAQHQCETQLAALQERQEQAEAAAARRADADAAVVSEAQVHMQAWAEHMAGLQQLVVDADPVLVALTDWALQLTGEHPGRQALLLAQQEASTRTGARQVALQGQQAALEAERQELAGEQQRLLAGVDAEPAAPPERAAGTRTDLRGAPLWKLVDFRAHLEQAERAGLEAALQASGLLDAWVTPDGQLVSVADGSPWLDAQWVRRGARPQAALSQWLRADVGPDAAVPQQAVEDLLSSVACGLVEPAQAEAWIAPDGRWRLAGLRGAWAKTQAMFIGHAARLAARHKRLADIAARLAALEEQQAVLEGEQRQVQRAREQAQREWQAAPSEQTLRQAHEAAVARAREFQEIRAQLARVETRWREADEAARLALTALERDATDLHLPTDAAGLEQVEEAVHGFGDAVHGAAQAASHWRAAAAELSVQTEREATARLRVESCSQQTELRRAELEEAQARWAVLQESTGAAADAIRARVSQAREAVRKGEDQLRGAEAALRRAGEARARAEERFEAADAALEQRGAARAEAVRRLQAFAAAGLLSSALPELELPSNQVPWTIDPALALARRAEQLLASVKDDDDSFKRIGHRIAEDFQELQRALGALGQQASGEPTEFGLVIHTVYRNRPERPDRLAALLADEIAQRRELLTAREREVLENHLQAEIAAEIQRLIRVAEKQVEDINRELHKRPTSTGVRFRLQWEALEEGQGAPVGLHAAREKLLRTSADLWSQEDRRVVGAMLQQRILDERQRSDGVGEAEAGLVEQLARALDYRQWHQFRVQRLQDGQWRKLSGPASSGERALGLTVPLFAAIASFYGHSAQRLAPRLMLLDEAFAGIDDAARAHCMALVREFDLDFVITSEREWACYSELPGVAICQLQRREGIDAVYVSRWTWDGRSRRRDEDPDRRFPPP
ncbi:TIGR02680 family protein [Ramlibacter sp. AN1133]|uniref:TIGR02680 family protein n=1 Tax=Ramlibacter sp. AN1133 TaxID=3133429 RepID=UPI0030BB7E1B